MNEFVEAALQRGYCTDNLLVLSNLAFFISAYISYIYIARSNIKSKSLQLFPVLILFIGLGSSIFHSDQNLITLLFDMIPLYIFIFYSMFLILKETTKSLFMQVSFLLIFFALLVLTPYFVPVEFLNNSIRYIITLLFGSFLSFWLIKKYQGLEMMIFLVVGSFIAAICLRSLDVYTCEVFSFGTHSFWHIAIAVTTFLVTKLLVNIRTAKPRYYAPKG